ncbi:MAG: septum formation initiator family protein [Gammaproteobacteria bacterium]|nr:septum formation initiator family protein [Gammaproteobacteria bacterium]
MSVLFVLLVGLQQQLWLGDGSLEEVRDLDRRTRAQQGENEQYLERNRALDAEVRDLKGGLEAIEERARRELGMTRKDETFYLLVEE